MVDRKTIRPVTLRRVIEVCSLAVKTNRIDTTIVSQKLSVSSERAKEIVLELEKMDLLARSGDSYGASGNTTRFLDHFENDEWGRIHEYFLANYQFYKDFILILQGHIIDLKGLSLNEIKEESITHKLSLNQTAVEVLSNWCERLGIVQRHLYARRIYLTKNQAIDSKTFKDALVRCYRELSVSRGRRGIFAEIPILREDLCEVLKIGRRIFDVMLHATYLENVGKMELSGAPITTLAKKSPLSEKKMTLVGKEAILSPKFEIAKDREGLMIGQKAYYYLAIHEEI